jgi:RNA polymerase sigma-B factor
MTAMLSGSDADGSPETRRSIELEDERALLRRYAATRSPELRDELVNRFMPLARSLAMRYRRRSESLDDLVGVANLGLVKAIDGYDPTRGPFASYAVPTILGELRRHFRDHVWNVRLPRGLQELTMKVDEATNELTEELGHYPTTAQIGERLGISTEDVLEALEAAYARRTMSLDAPRLAEEEATPTVETIGRAEAGYERVEADLVAEKAGLDRREWEVLRLRFVDELTQREIGRRLGVSQMQISRISRRALWKLLAAVRGERPAGEVPSSAVREPLEGEADDRASSGVDRVGEAEEQTNRRREEAGR